MILSLATNNPIAEANKAKFLSDVGSYKEELSFYMLKAYTNQLGAFEPKTLTDITGDKLKDYIPSMKESNKEKFAIMLGELVLTDKASEEEKNWFDGDVVAPPIDNSYGTNGNTKVGVAKVNRPMIKEGLTPIKFDTNLNPMITNEKDSDWYAYISQGNHGIDGKTSVWANAQSEDGSEWVWIPRYAYKITTPATSTASEINVIFLKGTTNTYEDDNGNLIHISEDYIVHPAFTNDIAAGGWDNELTGIWIAKYEAGYAGQNGIAEHVSDKQNSTLRYTAVKISNNVYGEITTNVTPIQYPVFKSNAYSYNNINVGDCYALSKALMNENNPFGFTTEANSHMIKNSEWGAMVYLAHSKYGRNGIEITINSKNLNNNPVSIYAITGGGDYKVNTQQSSTGNVSGIYDISGGVWERVSVYCLGSQSSSTRDEYGGSLITDGGASSNKFKTIYSNASSETKVDNFNYPANKVRKGEAVWETRVNVNSPYTNAWFNDYSNFIGESHPFFVRGGFCTEGSSAGSFAFYGAGGHQHYNTGFRAVLTFLN